MVGQPVPTPHFFAWLPASVFIIPCISFVFTDMISDFLKLIKTIFWKKIIIIIYKTSWCYHFIFFQNPVFQHYFARGDMNFQMHDFSGAVDDFTHALDAMRDTSTWKVNALIRRAHCFLFLVSFQLWTRPCGYKIFILNWLGLFYRNEFVVYHQ